MIDVNKLLIPAYNDAVEAVVVAAQEAGEYPELFDDEHIVDTMRKVIELARPDHIVPQARSERELSARKAALHIGIYTTKHRL